MHDVWIIKKFKPFQTDIIKNFVHINGNYVNNGELYRAN